MDNPNLSLEQIRERKKHVEDMIATVLKDLEQATGLEVEAVDLTKLIAIGQAKEIYEVSLSMRVN